MDHFGYRAPDFSFIHESIWYDLSCFENWLIDRRGLSLEDGIPLVSHRPPDPAFPMSDNSEESVTDEEEPFISASSTASKAASLPENIAESGLEPSSSKATIGNGLDVSSIEKLDGIESFMAPLTTEAIAKADTLLKLCGNDTVSTTTSSVIMDWLHRTDTGPSPFITEVPYPLALSPSSGITKLDEIPTPKESLVSTAIVKEEFSTSTPFTSTASTPDAKSPSSKPRPRSISISEGDGEITFSPMRPKPIGASAPLVAPRKPKPKARSFSVLCSALEVPLGVKLLAGNKKPKAFSTPQGITVLYNPHASHIGGFPTGSIEMHELNNLPIPSMKKKKEQSPQ